MADEFNYLLHSNEEEILQTWHALGAICVDNNTKIYNRGSVVRITTKKKCPLKDKIIYIRETYRVDNKLRFPIVWEEMGIDDVNGQSVACQGINVPYFGVLPAKWAGGFMPDPKFLPYSDEARVEVDTGGITISDDELETCLTIIGLPFVYFEDLEFSKSQIIKYMVKPAMQRFFTYRPIIEEEGYGCVAAGAEFCVQFPENAHGVVPYYCTPGGGNNAGLSGSPFAFYNEQMMAGVGSVGSRYGKGIHYPGKQVPGYVGLQWKSAYLNELLANQGMINFFKREHYKRKKIDGKWYATGFSTVSGNLNFKWLCHSYNWDDIGFEDLEVWARPMVRSEVLKNFVMIRSLVKTDISGQLDPAEFKAERDRIETELGLMCKAVSTSGIASLGRGGGN